MSKAQKIIDEAKKNARRFCDFYNDFIKEARDDKSCVDGDQWDDIEKQKRIGRPTEVINDMKITIRRTVEDYDQKRSQIKARGKDSYTAEAAQGIIYQIHNDSLGEDIKDSAMYDMLGCGMGFFKWETEYEKDLSFNQIIKLKPIKDPFNVYLDIMNCNEMDNSDVLWGGENLYYECEAFEEMWPDAEKESFPDLHGQYNDGRICVSRYERIEYKNDTVISIANPFTGKPLIMYITDFEKEEYIPLLNYFREYGYDQQDDIFAWLSETGRILRDKDVERPVVKWYLLSGTEILDEGETGGEFVPIIPMLGPRYVLNGSVYYDSLIRQTKDPARLSNLVISNYKETLLSDTISPWLTNWKKIKNHQNTWAQANIKPVAALPYDEIELQDGTIDNTPPVKLNKGDAPAGWATLFQFANESKERTSGLPDSAAGLQGNEVSGSALDIRTNNGLANRSIFFKKRHFADRLLGKQLEKAIPVYYDSQRVTNISNEQGTSQAVMINSESHDQGEGKFKGKFLDIKSGEFTTYITVGPSYNSLRQETTAKLAEVMSFATDRYRDVVFPELVKYADISDSDELYDNCMKVAPQEIQPQEEKTEQQLQSENAQLKQQLQEAQSINEEMNKIIMGEQQKVQSQERIAQLKSETDLQREEIKQRAETQRERMSNQTDIKQSEIDASAEVQVQMLKMMEELKRSINEVKQFRISEV